MTPMQEFLETFLSRKPSEQYFYLWTLSDKRSHWFLDAPAAIETASAVRDKTDVYIGMGLFPSARESSVRVNKSEVSGILGAWADIDIDVPGHHKGVSKLPPTLDDAMGLVAELPNPTMVVQSGGGLHLYWLFKQPWMFDTEQDRDQAETFLLKWQQVIKDAARPHNWKVDSTADPARVLRLPGTLNHKTDPASLVTLSVCEPERFYTDKYLWQLVKDVHIEKPRIARARARNGENTADDAPALLAETFTLNVNANPSLEKLDALLIGRRFKKTWNRRREDFTDQSASVYEMALADAMVMAGWSDQEIVDALVAWRRQNK